MTDGATGERGGGMRKAALRLHHNAYTTEDHELTRHFYEDILGFPLVAFYVEREYLLGEWMDLGHAFYGLADGSALAFFNFGDSAKQAAWRAKEQSIFCHIALLVERSSQTEIAQRLEDHGLKPAFKIEHGYCSSVYVKDPNGLLLELTVDPVNADEIASTMVATAREDMHAWNRGQRPFNNRWRQI